MSLIEAIKARKLLSPVIEVKYPAKEPEITFKINRPSSESIAYMKERARKTHMEADIADPIEKGNYLNWCLGYEAFNILWKNLSDWEASLPFDEEHKKLLYDQLISSEQHRTLGFSFLAALKEDEIQAGKKFQEATSTQQESASK